MSIRIKISRCGYFAFGLILSLGYTISVASSALALNDSLLDKFAANNIMFYDPEECTTDCRVECVGSDGSDITVIGDSLLADQTTKKMLKDKFSGLADDAYDAVVGRHWNQGVELAETMSLKNIVLFELSTNNNPSITAQQLNDLLDVVGQNRTLILFTPYSAAGGELSAAYGGTALLFKNTAKTNSQIVIADWAEKAKTANLQLNDGESRVHPTTEEERKLLVETLAGAIGGSCSTGEAVVSGVTAEEKTWSGFRSLGFTAAQTAGIMGNIAHEGLMNPAQWQVGHEQKSWGKSLAEIYARGSSNDTGMGLVAFTWYKYFDILNTYYSEKAPDLLAILEDPWTYSVADNGSHYCDGTTCFLKKVDDNTANRLYSTQITIINDVVRGKYKQSHGFDYSGYLSIDDPAACAEWWLTNYERPADPAASRAARISDAQKFYNQFKDKVSFSGSSSGGFAGTNCSGSSAATAFKKYNFTDGQLRGILAIAKHENGGSMAAIKTELSIMANLFEYKGPKLGEPDNEAGFVHYIQRKPGSESGWFSTYDKYDENYSVTTEELNAAKDILNNGNRTLPPQILEHDYIGDIKSVTNDGVSFDKNDRSKYIVGKTVIVALGDPYVFYTWADPSNNSGDPFGYFQNNPPDESFSVDSTKAANSATVAVNISWNKGWITGGMDGYTKGTPEMANLNVADSAPTMDYETSRPKDNQVGPNKILLHSTENVGNAGEYGLEIYRNNAYPPHFTVNLRTKEVFQHFSIDKPAADVDVVDRSAGVQIEIIGYSDESKKNDDWYLFNSSTFGDDEWAYLAKLLVGISDYTGIPLTSSVNWTDRTGSRLASVDEFKGYSGVLGHQHAPENTATDPGDVWSLLEKQIKTMNANVDLTCSGVEYVTEFEWMGQCDDRWRDTPYGACGTVCSSGCGVVSFTMMAQALTGVKLDVAEVTTNAGNKGLHACEANCECNGSKHSLPETLADDYGVSVEVLGRPSIDELNALLREGKMIWTCGGGANPFTDGGHCIGIRGITADGKWLLADSNGEKGRVNSTETEWDPNDVYPNMNNFRVLSRK